MPISRPFKGASYHLNFFYPRMFFVFLLGFFSLSWLICRKNRKKYWPVLNTRLVSNLQSQIGGSLTEQPDKSLIIIILRFSILFLFVNLSFHLNFDLFLFFFLFYFALFRWSGCRRFIKVETLERYEMEKRANMRAQKAHKNLRGCVVCRERQVTKLTYFYNSFALKHTSDMHARYKGKSRAYLLQFRCDSLFSTFPHAIHPRYCMF